MGLQSWFISTLAPFMLCVSATLHFLTSPVSKRPEQADGRPLSLSPFLASLLLPTYLLSGLNRSTFDHVHAFDPANRGTVSAMTAMLDDAAGVRGFYSKQADRLAETASPPLLLLFIISSGSLDNRLSVKRGGINLILTIAGKTHTRTRSHTQCMSAFQRSPAQGLKPCGVLLTVCLWYLIDVVYPFFSH